MRRMADSGQVTQLLRARAAGDQIALRALLVVEGEPRRLARRHSGSEHRDDTPKAAALVDETLVCLTEERSL